MKEEPIKGFILIVYKEQNIFININHIVKIEPFVYQCEPDATDKCKITLSNEIKPMIVEYPMDSILNMIEEANL